MEGEGGGEELDKKMMMDGLTREGGKEGWLGCEGGED
jgi:hypothetical protein